MYFVFFALQLQQSEISATRSGNLVQELYIENAKLTKALQQTEANEKRAEKANRQLTEQKKALQRVISKLCGANAIAWEWNSFLAVFLRTSSRRVALIQGLRRHYWFPIEKYLRCSLKAFDSIHYVDKELHRTILYMEWTFLSFYINVTSFLKRCYKLHELELLILFNWILQQGFNPTEQW